MRQRVLIAAAVLALACIAAAVVFVETRSTQELLLEGQGRLAQRRYAEAEALAQRILTRTPNFSPALLLAGRAAVGQEQNETAFKYLSAALNDGTPASTECLATAGEIALQLGRAADAETFLRKALARNPTIGEANSRLAYLLGVEGRAWESFEFLVGAIRAGQATTEHLIMLGASEPVVADRDFVRRCLQAIPNDPLPKLGEARMALSQFDLTQSEPLLREIVAAVPHSAEAQARFGGLLLAKNDDTAFLNWHAHLPATVHHPEICVVRGQWAKHRGESRVAARCFWEAVCLDPNHRVANYQLGQSLRELERTEQAHPFLDRAAKLEQLASLVDRSYDNPHVAGVMLEAAQLTESLGRTLEAWGWASAAVANRPDLVAARELAERLQRDLRPDTPQTLAIADPSRMLDLTEWPLPEWSAPDKTADRPIANRVPTARVKFADVAASVGLDFSYDNGHDSQLGGMRMLESMGGGVAVLDYDLDGWPDTFFTQGTRWPRETNNVDPSDALFRNIGGTSFVNVTRQAGLIEAEFGQGCTVGDFDNDGFPDLYVANIGENRLYHNQGDGTFRDVTREAGIAGKLWTSSCLIADMNGDGLPDLYDVNYLAIADAPRAMCVKGDETRSCGPGSFTAEEDQVYLNLGDGRFENVTQTAGIVVPVGKGLGIVAADFTGTGRLNLFVANDAVPNFYFVNQSERDGSLKFSEQALVTGLAVDHAGLSQACMGVAAGDANGDGLLDLFVTNFEDQSNTLYQQDAAGLFNDVTPRTGLVGPSFPMLGFGTQFLDGELDGLPDLVVTNGHVYDLSYKGKPYHMRPQYFQNAGGATFHEVLPQQLGSFFEKKYLGRGLALIDWNRDGRQDFLVTNINATGSLVENRTEQPGHFLTIRLVGTRNSRDAIGTRVSLRCDNRQWTQQLTAGDGYQASNERKLTFGLGPATQVELIIIRWLNGTEQTFRDLPADRELLIIEGYEPVKVRNF